VPVVVVPSRERQAFLIRKYILSSCCACRVFAWERQEILTMLASWVSRSVPNVSISKTRWVSRVANVGFSKTHEYHTIIPTLASARLMSINYTVFRMLASARLMSITLRSQCWHQQGLMNSTLCSPMLASTRAHEYVLTGHIFFLLRNIQLVKAHIFGQELPRPFPAPKSAFGDLMKVCFRACWCAGTHWEVT